MNEASANAGRIRRAVEGDSVALAVVLANTTAAVREIVARRIPSDLARVIDSEDILQETDIEVFRRIATRLSSAGGAPSR